MTSVKSPAVLQADDGTWRVVRPNGKIIAEGLTHARAWQIWDEHDRNAAHMEEKRRGISIAQGQW
jgi:hypothetical protein